MIIQDESQLLLPVSYRCTLSIYIVWNEKDSGYGGERFCNLFNCYYLPLLRENSKHFSEVCRVQYHCK